MNPLEMLRRLPKRAQVAVMRADGRMRWRLGWITCIAPYDPRRLHVRRLMNEYVKRTVIVHSQPKLHGVYSSYAFTMTHKSKAKDKTEKTLTYKMTFVHMYDTFSSKFMTYCYASIYLKITHYETPYRIVHLMNMCKFDANLINLIDMCNFDQFDQY